MQFPIQGEGRREQVGDFRHSHCDSLRSPLYAIVLDNNIQQQADAVQSHYVCVKAQAKNIRLWFPGPAFASVVSMRADRTAQCCGGRLARPPRSRPCSRLPLTRRNAGKLAGASCKLSPDLAHMPPARQVGGIWCSRSFRTMTVSGPLLQ